ncbi:hypothetical protein [Ammoniphilus sp. 3BR4]|uniref:hypothetical protein n=1 Tax=Ammoniphilus sp. 3BR4 TaxID=3158265 RepID=UPI0034679E25
MIQYFYKAASAAFYDIRYWTGSFEEEEKRIPSAVNQSVTFTLIHIVLTLYTTNK